MVDYRERDQCYLDLAVKSREHRYCDRITSGQYAQTECYLNLGFLKEDEALCEKITASPYFRDYCISYVGILGGEQWVCEHVSKEYLYLKLKCYGAITNDSAHCNKITKEEEREYCRALAENNPILCKGVSSVDDRDKCHLLIAKKTGNQTTCESVDNLDWRGICYEKVGDM